MGGVIWPIMLNHLFNDSAGFSWGVRYVSHLFGLQHTLTRDDRASGFIALFLLSLAFLFMKTRLPSRRERPDAPPVLVKPLLTDVPYMICIVGYVESRA